MIKSYYRKPHRIRKKRTIFKSKVFWFLFFIIILTGTINYFLFFSQFFEVKKIEIIGNKKIKTEEVKNLLENQIWTDFFIFKNKNIYFIKTKKINNFLLNSFPQISNLSIKKKLPNMLEISIIEREPIAILKQNEECFFIDKEGVVFEKNNNCDQNFFLIKNSLLNQELKLAQEAVFKEDISKILQIKSYFQEEIKIPLKEFIIVSKERLDAKTQENWKVYFNLEGDIQWQLIKLKTLLEKRIPQEKRGKIEYIDLRFERIYVFPETYNQ